MKQSPGACSSLPSRHQPLIRYLPSGSSFLKADDVAPPASRPRRTSVRSHGSGQVKAQTCHAMPQGLCILGAPGSLPHRLPAASQPGSRDTASSPELCWRPEAEPQRAGWEQGWMLSTCHMLSLCFSPGLSSEPRELPGRGWAQPRGSTLAGLDLRLRRTAGPSAASATLKSSLAPPAPRGPGGQGLLGIPTGGQAGPQEAWRRGPAMGEQETRHSPGRAVILSCSARHWHPKGEK